MQRYRIPWVIDGVNTHNELGFGEIHELGHDFDLELDALIIYMAMPT